MVRELQRCGFDVFIFDREYSKEANHLRGDIMNPNDVSAAIKGCDIVFHIAGLLGTSELIEQNKEAVNVNILGTVNILEACIHHGVQRFFYPTKPNEWRNTYSITKKAGEEFAAMFYDIHGLDVRILRWLNAYGPGQKALPVRKAVPVMIIQALMNQDITVWGTGEQPVDLIFTEDLAKISVAFTLADALDATVRDTGLTHRLTVNALAGMIISLTHSQSRIVHKPMRVGEDQNKPVELLPNQDVATLLHRSESGTPLEEGMRQTIQYYQSLPPSTLQRVINFYKE